MFSTFRSFNFCARAFLRLLARHSTSLAVPQCVSLVSHRRSPVSVFFWRRPFGLCFLFPRAFCFHCLLRTISFCCCRCCCVFFSRGFPVRARVLRSVIHPARQRKGGDVRVGGNQFCLPVSFLSCSCFPLFWRWYVIFPFFLLFVFSVFLPYPHLVLLPSRLISTFSLSVLAGLKRKRKHPLCALDSANVVGSSFERTGALCERVALREAENPKLFSFFFVGRLRLSSFFLA